MTLADRLKQLRISRNLTLTAVGLALGYKAGSQAAVQPYHWENRYIRPSRRPKPKRHRHASKRRFATARSCPTLPILLDLAEWYGLSLSELLEGVDSL